MSEPTPQELASERAAGLRALADLVEATPEVNANYLDGSSSLTVWYAHKPDVLPALARAGLTYGAKVDKKINDTEIFELHLSFGPIRAVALAQRTDVCERVIVGTETVTETVKDPELLAKVPEIEQTVEREIVEWRCEPLLAADGGDS